MMLNKRKNGRISVITLIIVILLIVAVGFTVYIFVKKAPNTDNQTSDTSYNSTNKDANSKNTTKIIDIEHEKKKAQLLSQRDCQAFTIDEVECPEDKELQIDTDGDFLMPIEDVFTRTGRGTVAAGRIIRGTIHVGDKIEIIGKNNETIETTVIGIEMYRKSFDIATVGDNVGLLLADVEKDKISREQFAIKPKTLELHTEFEAEVYVHIDYFRRPTDQFFTTELDKNFRISNNIGMSSGKVTEIYDKEYAEDDDIVTIKIKLDTKVMAIVGSYIYIYEPHDMRDPVDDTYSLWSDVPVAYGKITKVIK